MVDVVLGALAGGGGDGIGRLTLRADEEHATATGDRVTDGEQRLMKQRHRLGEVDDVDVVAVAEEERGHLRVPAMGLVAEVNAGFQQLTHREFGQRHGTVTPFSGWTSAGGRTALNPRA